MAIIQGVPGLKVYIEVGGRPLKEYDIPQGSSDIQPPPALKVQKGNRTTSKGRRTISHGYVAKYIEVDAGTYPTVQFEKTEALRKDGHHIAYGVQFDDTELELRHQPPGRIYKHWKVIEENDIGYSKNSNVGTIRVDVYHMGVHKRQINEHFDCGRIECENIMSENAVSGRNFSHCLGVELGEKIENPEPEYHDNFLDKDPRPFAVFTFHYRSRDALIDMGVRTQEEVLEELQSKREELLVDRRIIEKRLKRVKHTMKKMKKRRKRKNKAREAVAVKAEMDRGAETIDLTGSP
ncbi:hypothetical protein F4860DRAFT_510159 [Xylaria cubensis]|nr:hypothetical protein F4860DRAFT_510159 [Xylaria cubensis]